MGRWYPRAVTDSRSVMRDTSKAHLYEVRSVSGKSLNFSFCLAGCIGGVAD